LEILNNTFIVGPKQFSEDAFHHDDPTEGHPGILINNAVHSGFLMWNNSTKKHIQHPGFHYPTRNIYIANNIVHGPSLNLIDTYNEHEGKEVHLSGNLFWSTKPGLPCIGQSGKIGYLDKSNKYKDPQFKKMPNYPFIDLMKNPEYDWSQFHCEYNLQSEMGGSKGK